ncbi:MAG TPA: type I DNA topoisomerase [Alphaproteobacteria bacterium]|nr:type I DNA topoisomerase [Alphaproteobacteria bacterium]
MSNASQNALVIVESPAKAKTIEGYLGKGYTVLASFGHIRDLPSKEGAVEPDNDFAMHYRVSPDSEKHVKAIMSAVKKVDTLYLATDLDREGEAISWHVWQVIKERDPKLAAKLNVHRIEFDEITKSAIQHAIAHPRELSLNLIDAQQARRALDYLVGFTLSPVLWRKVKTGLSAGRVQSVALRLLCEREDAIEAFKPDEYWTLHGAFKTPKGAALPANLGIYNGTKVEKFTFTNEANATAAKNALTPPGYTVADVEKSPRNRYPAPPFTTSTIQQEASRKLGFAARRTMMAAQRLYEAGHITYMRTDSVHLATEAVGKIRDAISKFYPGALPSSPLSYKSKQKNAQEAHEAIRPTDAFARPGSLRLEADQARLYELIWQRTVACQMAPAQMEQTVITINDASGKHQFRATGSVVVVPGFLSVYREDEDDVAAGSDDDKILPAVNKGDKLDTIRIDADQHFTEPPPRFSEASLVKALEEHGIGRPSTYASIISTLQDRGYVRIEQRRFFPEDVGRVVNKFLSTYFDEYINVKFTAEMEDDLDAIARGEHDWKPTLRQFWTPFKKQVDERAETVKKADMFEPTGEKCPECGEGDLIWRLSRFGRKFKGCNRYPECTYIEKTGPDAAGPELMGIPCPKCTPTGGAGELAKRVSRRGKVFYSCNTWPKCDYALWDEPVKQACPKCKWPIITKKESKKFGTWHRCPQKDCDWNDNAEAAAMNAAFAARFKKRTAPEGTTASAAKGKAAPKAAKAAPAKKASAKKPAAKKK